MSETNDKNAQAAVEASEASEIELLRKLLQDEDKEVKYFKWAARFMFVIALAVVITLIIVIPKVMSTLDEISKVAAVAEETLVNANDAVNELTAMSQDVSDLSSQMSVFIENNTSGMEQAMNGINEGMKNINDIDFAGLNKAIRDLQDAVGPFASLMRRF